MTREHNYKKVISLRKQGMSLGDISKFTGVAKSTISTWCSNVVITKEAKSKIKHKWLIATNKGRLMGASTNRQKKIASISEQRTQAYSMLGKVGERDPFILGLGLYWAEGSKKGDSASFSFINSDPKMIYLMVSWLQVYFGIKKEDIILKVSVNMVHKHRIDKILNFWSELLEWPLSSFGSVLYIKTPYRRMYNNHEDYYGMLRLRVNKSVWLKRRVVSMIDLLAQHADVAQVVRASHS